MKYASHIWGRFTHTALLTRVGSKVFRLNNSPHRTTCFLLSPLKFRRIFAFCISFIAIFINFHAHCSSKLADCMSPPPSAATLHSAFLFFSPLFLPIFLRKRQPVPLCFHLSWLGNRLPASVFPPSYDLQFSKRVVSRHHAFRIGYTLIGLLRFCGAAILWFFSPLLCPWAVSCVVKIKKRRKTCYKLWRSQRSN